ncbi:tyrosine-type recombinase/integrase [Pseudomonas syringae]|uniref:tyrosine-type recombinase/integrase n=1 Tax=Pseudomonas syringae TaxID=317 RepID=UPI003F74D74C
MRVPLYPDDLLPKNGFKRLAKRFQRDWPGLSPIGLSQSREVLAKALGYRDYHDARLSAASGSSQAEAPDVVEARNQIAASLSQAPGQDGQSSLTVAGFQPFVQSLPLDLLKAFSHLHPSQPLPATSSDAQSTLGGDQHAPSSSIPASPGSPSTTAMPLKAETNRRLMTTEELDAIRAVVARSGDLRDQLILEMMLTGLRITEIRGSVINAGSEIVTPSLKGPEGEFVITLDRSLTGTLPAYVQKKGLKPGDLLFPSKRDVKSPEPATSFAKRFRKWASHAEVDRGLTPHSMRKLVVSRLVKSLQPADIQDIQRLMGHSSPKMTQYYASKIINDPDN